MRIDLAGERHENHTSPRIQGVVGRWHQPFPSRLALRLVLGDAQRQDLLFGRNADEAEQFSQAVFGVQGALGLEEADLVRIPRHQLTDSRVVLVPVARDPLPPVLRFILGKNPRPNGVMVPTRARRFCPMVRGQRVGPFQPPAETLDHLFARAFQADNPNSRFHGNRILQVGQIERRHIADEVGVSRSAESREPLANHTFARLAFPRQKRRLLVRHLDSRLLVEHGGK